MYWEHPDVQDGFQRGSGTRNQVANIHWIMDLAREYQKNIYLCFIEYAKAFDYVDHDKLWKGLRKMGISAYLTCLLRNLYVGQEAAVRTLYRTTGWLKIEKGVWQSCMLLPCLFNLYTEHIMRNVRLDELQARIKWVGETSTTSDMWMIPPEWQKVKRNQSFLHLDEGEGGEWKNHFKTKYLKN